MNTASRHIAAAAVAAMACAIATTAVTAPMDAVAAPSTVLSVSPAHPDPAVAAGASYFVHSVAPGARWASVVAVVNTGDTTISAWVDPVDGVTSIRTGAVYVARGVPPVGAGAWIKSSVSSVTVPARGQGEVGFTVAVPVGAAVGDHVAGLAFESKQSKSSGSSTAITTVLRSVVAVQVRVPGPAIFQLKLYDGSVRAISTTGTSGVALDMANIGGLLDKPHLVITLQGPDGYHRTERLTLDTMLPGDRITDEFAWPDALPVGDYSITVTEDGSGRHGIAFVTFARVAASLRPAVPTQLSDVLPPASRGYQPAGIPWALPAAGAASLIIAILLLMARRRPLRRTRPR